MKVAIAWYGAEGQASYEYYTAKGDDVTIVTPQFSPDFPAPSGAKAITGPDAFERLKDFDLVIRSAGTRPDTLHTKGKVWSATNEFFAHCPAPIIGVTGTKGKGTTSSFITSILRASGKTVHLVGNIGVPPLELLDTIQPDDIVVYELSSFQLWDIERSPRVSVVLMIEPDHLNVHTDMSEYVDAKANIARFQQADDVVIYHPTNEYSRYIADQSAGRRLRYATKESVYINEGNFMTNDTVICPVSSVALPGEFNQQNACAAIAAALQFQVNSAAIEQGLRAFNGLPHRLKFIAEKEGVKYYDDSIATTPGSAIAALRSFDGPKVIILGGESKGVQYGDVVAAAKHAGAKIVAVGQTGGEIDRLAKQEGVESQYVEGLMDEAVRAAAHMAGGAGVVMLSPAAASFDQYKGYADRGDQFIAAVNNL